MITRTLLGTLLVVLAGSAFGQGCCAPTPSPSAALQVKTDKAGVQKATVVVNNGFAPGTLTVKANQPVEITFDTKSRGCATSVNFHGLNLKKDLVNGKKTVVKFTPKKPGTYTFACPMNMIKGTLIVQ